MTISNRFKESDLLINYTTALACLRPEWVIGVGKDHLATCCLPNKIRRTIVPQGDYLIRLDFDDTCSSVVITATRVAYSGRDYCLCRHTKEVHRAMLHISYGGYLDSLRRFIWALSRKQARPELPEVVAFFNKSDSFSFFLSESCHNLILDWWLTHDEDEDAQHSSSASSSWDRWRAKYVWGRISRRIETLLRCHNGMELR